MRKSTMHDAILLNSAVALMVAGVALIVIGTWSTSKEANQRNESIIAENETVIEKTAPSRSAAEGPYSSETAQTSVSENAISPADVAGRPVYSAEGTHLGEVIKVSVGENGQIREIYVETATFLGLGTKIVRIPAGMFEKKGEQIELVLTANAVESLPQTE